MLGQVFFVGTQKSKRGFSLKLQQKIYRKSPKIKKNPPKSTFYMKNFQRKTPKTEKSNEKHYLPLIRYSTKSQFFHIFAKSPVFFSLKKMLNVSCGQTERPDVHFLLDKQKKSHSVRSVSLFENSTGPIFTQSLRGSIKFQFFFFERKTTFRENLTSMKN